MALKIAVEKSKSEFEIQAEAYRLLSEALGEKYLVRGEYTYRGCRFDLAIFDAASRDLICTIEIKRTKTKGWTRKASHVRQTTRYQRATGKPCLLLNEATMRSAVQQIKARLTPTT